MKIEEIRLNLEERGIVWQAVGFAAIGTLTLIVLSVYSDSPHRIIETYRIAATQLNWAYIAIIALAIEGARTMFETRTQIGQKARKKLIAKGQQEGERKANERTRAALLKHGIQLPPEAEKDIFNSNGR